MPIMPNVVGLDWQQATAYLIQAGIVPDNGLLPTNNPAGGSYVVLGYFDAWPIQMQWVRGSGTVGFVTAQAPAAGATVPAYTVSAVSVSAHYIPPITLTANSFPFGIADKYSAGGYQ